uniref:uncharacterized protein LOC105350687 isoform X2 n=1 Tax=Fragaria vesca subsp. vesca TaxID=101020 RepID=UPI0005C894B2|nr:PREDICTED: uncharacterized protein LOC105350687 isoform X2 [Fragaria vesca subsp. vesca]
MLKQLPVFLALETELKSSRKAWQHELEDYRSRPKQAHEKCTFVSVWKCHIYPLNCFCEFSFGKGVEFYWQLDMVGTFGEAVWLKQRQEL